MNKDKYILINKDEPAVYLKNPFVHPDAARIQAAAAERIRAENERAEAEQALKDRIAGISITEVIGRRVKLARIAAGWTPNDVVASMEKIFLETSFDRQTLTEIESGEREPTENRVAAFAGFFGKDAGALTNPMLSKSEETFFLEAANASKQRLAG